MASGRRRGQRDEAWRPRNYNFRHLIDEAKQCKNLSDIIGRHTVLKRRGQAEKVGLCPFHQERSPSLEVNDAKGRFYCHGCGASGDAFTVLTKLDGLNFRDAYAALTNDTFPTVSEEDRARQKAEDEQARRAAVVDAEALWMSGISVKGTPAEVYLREIRGITAPLPRTVRFGVVPTSRDENGKWKRPYPAVLCACTGPAGGIVGLQRIFLLDDGTDKRWGKRSKFSIGRPKGSSFKLGPEAQEIVLCEGPEDGLSLMQGLPGQSVWVALGTAMMPEIGLPLGVRSVVIAGQNDAPGKAATAKAALALTERGLRVRTMFPDAAFKDWNDQLRGIAL